MSLIVANAVSIPRECCPKISEFMKRNLSGNSCIKFTKGNYGFYNGAKPKKIKFSFWVEYIKRCRIATFGGVCFLRKNSFYLYFHEKITILDV